MNIKSAEQKLHQVDSFLTTLTKLLKKHWLILLLILFCASVYFVWNYEELDETEQIEEIP
jgi:type II secretory pathway component PulF